MPDYEFFIFIADLHAITIYKDKQFLRTKIKELAALYIACGLDPKRVNLFIQSEVPAHSQMAYLLQCNSYIGELERMTQYKDKAKKQESGVTVGLFTYPTLMAADILLYDPDFVPVGKDQKQHLELTRDIAVRVNNKYNDIFTVPDPLIAEVGAKINSLTDPSSKMSKSDSNEKSRINMLDPENIIKKRIKSAITDSLGNVAYDPENRPGISNLMTIYHVISDMPFKGIEKKYTTKEIFNHFNMNVNDNSGQFAGTVLIMKNTEKMMKIIDECTNVLRTDHLLVTDHYNKIQESYFIDNRHEQSILSLVRKKRGSIILSDETWFIPFGNKESLKYPFWATRKR
jgi:tryptophanyl-tRNA synthetase